VRYIVSSLLRPNFYVEVFDFAVVGLDAGPAGAGFHATGPIRRGANHSAFRGVPITRTCYVSGVSPLAIVPIT
jgi:hypothetical protein